MSLNSVILNGRLPRFEANYKKGEGDKKSFLSWAISVRRDVKPADAQYYPEDLIKFKAFGPKADFIMNNFAMGDGLIITGKLQKEEDYEKDGQTVTGGLAVIVDTVAFADSKASEKSAGGSAPTGAGAKTPTGKPNIPAGKPGIPGAKPNFIPGSKPAIPGRR